MRQRRHLDGSLVIVPARWVRISFWTVLVVGLFVLILGLAGVAGGVAELDVLAPVGLLLVFAGGLGLRMRVKVNRLGISCRFFGTASVLLADLDRLEINHVAGRGSASRAQVVVVRRNGAPMRLDPTIVSTSGPHHDALRSCVAEIYDALGIDAAPHDY